MTSSQAYLCIAPKLLTGNLYVLRVTIYYMTGGIGESKDRDAKNNKNNSLWEIFFHISYGSSRFTSYKCSVFFIQDAWFLALRLPIFA